MTHSKRTLVSAAAVCFFLLGLNRVAEAAAKSQPFDLNDASVLLPLPGPTDLALLLSPSDQSAKGLLFPRDDFEVFGDLVSGLTNESVYTRELKVVGIRLDPCFSEGTAPVRCRRQVRLIWQPVFATRTQTTTTLDAAAHTFYEFKNDTLGDSEWGALIDAWPRLKENDRGRPLQPNPEISRDGLAASPYWKKLRALLLRTVGAKNLTRVTTMALPFDNLWTFRGFNKDENGNRKPLNIPRTNTNRQTFALSLDPKKFEGGLDPRLPQEMIWNIFLKDSDEIKVAGAVQTIADIADDISNPTRENTGTIDCASCHVAQGARRWVENDWRFPQLSAFPNRYGNRGQNLMNLTSSSKTNRLRAFGYFGSETFISQRVINETAMAVDALR